jgi:nucleotide-binding universal stress UspA family protein
MKSKKYKLLVLSDLNDSTLDIIKSSVSLAKIIDGEINFFYVKKPTDIVGKENQLSAMRAINKEHTVIDNKIKTVLKTISSDFAFDINYSFTFGNVKNEIEKYIDEQQPDIIVIGKRKSKSLNFIGDKLTDFILKKHQGIIMVVATKNALEPNKHMSLGLLDGLEQALLTEFTDDLLANSQKPLKSFKIVKSSIGANKYGDSSDKKIIEYVFEKDENSIKTLAKYLTKNNVNLFCLDRASTTSSTKANIIKPNIKEIINTLNVSLLLTNSKQ